MTASTRSPNWTNRLLSPFKFLDGHYFKEGADYVRTKPQEIVWHRAAPFIFLHIGCLGVLIWGVSPVAVGVAVSLYLLRIFAITGFYHRYFSHRTFKTSRVGQLIFAIIGNLSVQRGAIWWAAHHRVHHQYTDKEEDVHSPLTRGFFWSHMGWILSDANMPTKYERCPDLVKFPELVFLNRFDWLVPTVLFISLYILGSLLPSSYGTSGWQMVTWGFFVSTVFLFHATVTINSFSHMYGSQRYDTGDSSKNNFLLAILTMGEGWHNNHHRYMGTARQGFYWWEVDITYYGLKLLEKLGIIWDLRPVPQEAYDQNKQLTGSAK